MIIFLNFLKILRLLLLLLFGSLVFLISLWFFFYFKCRNFWFYGFQNVCVFDTINISKLDHLRFIIMHPEKTYLVITIFNQKIKMGEIYWRKTNSFFFNLRWRLTQWPNLLAILNIIDYQWSFLTIIYFYRKMYLILCKACFT